MKKIKVTVFTTTSSEHGLHVGEVGPVDPNDDDCADGSCDSAAGPVDQSAQLKKNLDEVKNQLGESVRIDVIDYENPSSFQVGMDILNQALEFAGTEPIATPDKFAMFVNSSAPLIVVNNKIAFTGTVPPSFQIISRIKAALR